MERFADQLTATLKALALSRGRLASELAVDKSVVSRWLSGASAPGNHNMARLTTLVARHAPGFTMLDWELPEAELLARLGVSPLPGTGKTPPSAPDFAGLPVVAGARRDTLVRGQRYCGVWRLTRPMMARPDEFVCEHLEIWRDGDWLKGCVHNIVAELPVVGMVADGQLMLFISVQNSLVTLLFNRLDEPLVDQVDGLILSPTVANDRTPAASRIVAERIGAADLADDERDDLIAAHAAERRVLTADALPDGLAALLLPDCGPRARAEGGERLLRADSSGALIRSRWS